VTGRPAEAPPLAPSFGWPSVGSLHFANDPAFWLPETEEMGLTLYLAVELHMCTVIIYDIWPLLRSYPKLWCFLNVITMTPPIEQKKAN